MVSLTKVIRRIRKRRVFPEHYHHQDAAYKRMTRVRIPLKTAMLALFLLTVGSVFVPLGIYWWATAEDDASESERGIAFCILGSLALIPGVYQSGLLLLAFMRVPGYSYQHIDTFEDEWDIGDNITVEHDETDDDDDDDDTNGRGILKR